MGSFEAERRQHLQALGAAPGKVKKKKKKIEYLFLIGFSHSPTPSHGVAALGSARLMPPALE